MRLFHWQTNLGRSCSRQVHIRTGRVPCRPDPCPAHGKFSENSTLKSFETFAKKILNTYLCKQRQTAKPWRRHQKETFSALLVLSPVRSPVYSLHTEGQWRRALVFSLIFAWKKQRLSNQSRQQWFETPLQMSVKCSGRTVTKSRQVINVTLCYFWGSNRMSVSKKLFQIL